MESNTIHGDKAHRDQHWAGQYFGAGGALDVARQACSLKERLVDVPQPFVHDEDDLLRAQMRLMSTVFSALGHCVAKLRVRSGGIKSIVWHLYQCLRLVFELEDIVAKTVMSSKKMEPGERDVLIAALSVSALISWVHLVFWYRREAAELVKMQVKGLPFDHVSSLFAKGRGCHMKRHFSESERDDFLEHVQFAIVHYAPDGKDPKLSWSDVARLARFVGNTKRQQYAARMDGSPDAKLKAGVNN